MTTSSNQKTAVFLMAAALVTFLGVSSVYAGHHCTGKSCGMEMTIDKKFDHKVKFIDQHEDELALTDEQKKNIKAIKITLQKNLIEQNAKIETAALDLEAGLHEKSINVNDMNTLVDQKYDAKKTAAKNSIKALADLKNVLSDQQHAAMKKLWMEAEKKGGKDKD